MFVVKIKQIEVFRNILENKFINDATQHLTKTFPIKSSGLTKDSMEFLIRNGIEESAKFGITERQEVLIYLEYTLCLGLNFIDSQDNIWIKRILKISNISGTEKMLRIQNIKNLINEYQ